MDTSYYVQTSSSSSLDPSTYTGIMIGVIVLTLVLYIVFSIFTAKIFQKAGEAAWKAWVPVLNSWVFLELGGQKGWIALLSLLAIIPFIGWIGSIIALVFMAIAAYRIGLNLQKEGWFVLLYVLVSPVWLIWLAVDSSKWTPVAANANNPAAPQPPAPAAAPENYEQNQNPTPPTPPVVS
ncbi:MAG: hypothetical protein JWM00_636 [Candidatus Saccharibacteria bacterium]|nr:hypothetical protein [Candidatus Saccharibacteria bacterium]